MKSRPSTGSRHLEVKAWSDSGIILFFFFMRGHCCHYKTYFFKISCVQKLCFEGKSGVRKSYDS